MTSLSFGVAITAPASPGVTGVSIITAPTLAAITEGDTLADVVTWGSATRSDGEALTGAGPAREMNIDGGGWIAYVGSTTPAAGETVRVRETWTTVEDSTQTFTSAEQAVAYITPTVTQDPQLTATHNRGDVIDLLAAAGSATPAGAVASIEAWTYNGADITGGIVAGDYDTSGLSAYGNDGELALRIRWTNGDQSTLSAINTATLVDVPNAMDATNFSLAGNGDGTVELNIGEEPDNGNQPNGFRAQYQVDAGMWRDVPGYAGMASYTLTTDILTGSQDVAVRFVNDVGSGASSAAKSVPVASTGSITGIIGRTEGIHIEYTGSLKITSRTDGIFVEAS